MLFRRRRGGALVGGPAAAGPGPEQRIGTRFVMRQKMFAFGDDFTVTDEQGRKVFSVDGKVLRIRDVIRLLDLLVVAKDEDGQVTGLDLSDLEGPPGEEEAAYGSLLATLVGLDLAGDAMAAAEEV